ncbi:uncharacterized protein LOC132053914 [Lycium ferocissimum]|uniref:uncharacterized protein LOC132053914 n=1 Tax=Lycium ferocissimum TaxID=112874 RepID=UPI002815CBA6|nr:uncharacterized protein LOC132053914 [Lycium ferocissimum]
MAYVPLLTQGEGQSSFIPSAGTEGPDRELESIAAGIVPSGFSYTNDCKVLHHLDPVEDFESLIDDSAITTVREDCRLGADVDLLPVGEGLSKATRIRGQETAEASADEQDIEAPGQGDLIVRRKRKSSESSQAPSQAKKRSRDVTREASSGGTPARALDAEVVGQLLDHSDDDDQVWGGHHLIDELLEHDLPSSAAATPPLVKSSSRIPSDISKSTDASVLHHASFHRFRHEVGRLKEELDIKSREVDELMALYEKKLEYISSLPDLSLLKSDLAAARSEAAEAKRERDQLAEKVKAFEIYNKSLIADANTLASQARAYVSQIDQLRAELDGIKPELDSLHEATVGAVAERDILREQLRSSSEQTNSLSASLAAAEVERDQLSQLSGYDDMLEQYKVDVTAVEKSSDLRAEYERCLSRRRTLEEVQATGVDLSGLIEEAKKLEAEAKAAFDPEDSDIDAESADEGAEESDKE